MRLFIIRHASNNWNKFGFLSETDIDLNDKGIIQAKKLGLKMKNYKIDAIFSSPMKRCTSTAAEIAKMNNSKVILSDDLKEVNFGIFEGMSLDEAKSSFPEIYEKREIDKWNFIIPQGESYKLAYERLSKFLEKIKKNFSNKSVVIVTHATLIKLLLLYFSKYSMECIIKNKVGKIKEASCLMISIGPNNKIQYKTIE